MQTKLYSEILEKINSFGEVICKDENGKDCEVVDDFKYPELAQSIEQLLLSKIKNVIKISYGQAKQSKLTVGEVENQILKSL